MKNQLTLVFTTIQDTTSSMLKWRDHIASRFPVIVIGDAKGPKSYDPQFDFYSIEKQKSLPFELAKAAPENHYSRKNIGYLVAISKGTEAIYESDDDNAPLSSWIPRHDFEVECKVVSENFRWVNAYRFFSKENIWPRGFPLSKILEPLSENAAKYERIFAPIQQGLANESPDVDAIWRFVFDKSVFFENSESIGLLRSAWCPFNSQTTWWHKIAFPLLYLPSHCSFRMTDIWRSFIAQRCLWEMGGSVVFHAPEVEQKRNYHSIQRDFEQEIDGYLANHVIAEKLQEINFPSQDPFENMRICYENLVSEGMFPETELELLHLWTNDLKQLAT